MCFVWKDAFGKLKFNASSGSESELFFRTAFILKKPHYFEQCHILDITVFVKETLLEYLPQSQYCSAANVGPFCRKPCGLWVKCQLNWWHSIYEGSGIFCVILYTRLLFPDMPRKPHKSNSQTTLEILGTC